MPLVVLAIPLYDLLSVVTIRLRQGRSPFVGDEQHFSHRFVMRGLSRRTAVLIIWGCTLVTGIGGVLLSRLEDWQAVLIGVQTIVILAFLAVYERAALRASNLLNGSPLQSNSSARDHSGSHDETGGGHEKARH